MRRAAWLCVACLLAVGTVWAATVYEVYRVQPGDTVESIAAARAISPKELAELNPHLLTGSLTVNELLTVPVPARPRAERTAPPAAPSPNGANAAGTIREAVEAGPKLYGPDGSVIGAAPEATAPLGANGGDGSGGAAPAVGPALGVPDEPGLQKRFDVNGAVGRLGLVVSDRSPIYRERRVDSPVLYEAPRAMKLVVVSQADDWYGVMMVDRSIGWIAAQFVRLTNTELVAGVPTTQGSEFGRRVVQEAYKYLGVPYVWGGNGFSGLDCSGLVQQCYKSQGVILPRVSREQFNVGTPVNWNELQPGDRLYFASDGRRIDHTGIYIGNGQFIHASGRRNAVCIDNLFNPRYWSMFVGAKR